MSDIQYSVEFHAVKFTKYKSAAPKHLLKKVGRWQKAGIYGGFDNIDYVPEILTKNIDVYKAAKDMYHELQDVLHHNGDDLGCILKDSIIKTLAKAKGLSNGR